MVKTPFSFFRQEVLDHKRDTWLGEISLARPISFCFFAVLFFFIALSVVAYLVLGEYTKKARASGYLVPDQGLLKIYPQQTGAVASLMVVEGQIVKKGDLVAIISTERTSMQGNTQIEIAKQLSLRKMSLVEEKSKTRQLYAEQIGSARKRLLQLAQEQEQLSRAVAAQQQRVQLSQSGVDRYTQLASEKFVSELALQEKRGDLLDQQNRLRDFQRNKIASERDAVALQAELNSLPTRERNDIAGLDRSIAEITANGLENEAHRESYVLAPADGMVTAFQIDRGKQASPAQPLMSLIPAGTQIRADLYVPSRSVGFVRIGGAARLQYQTFPYQKFGSHQGQVVKVSRTAVPAQELPFPASATDVYYVITVQPDEEYVVAYGKKEHLQVGMQVDADIWLDRRTLLEWILEPLYSVSGRV
ncbi:HlyD family secretion protein [Variovorax sp. ZT4R33]|uniref:HlyD family secretion protein n=1 Tax=Variovorax sp. ZT4R33 TaxID=3443743 RepID=UPI003F470FDC